MDSSADSLVIFTPWMELPLGDDKADQSDRSKDALFQWRVKELLQTQCPWLPPLIRSARAQIIAGPGNFFLSLPDGVVVQVPDLSMHLTLLPWVEPGEIAH